MFAVEKHDGNSMAPVSRVNVQDLKLHTYYVTRLALGSRFSRAISGQFPTLVLA